MPLHMPWRKCFGKAGALTLLAMLSCQPCLAEEAGANIGDMMGVKHAGEIGRLETALLSHPEDNLLFPRIREMKAIKDACDDPALARGGQVMEWLAKAAREKDFRGKLQAILDFWNARISYATDMEVHGKADFWALPSVTLEKGRGDCEDFALAYLASAHGLGLADARDMRIFVVRDRQSGNQGHAIAGILHGGHLYFMDNQNGKVMSEKDLAGRYTVVYSVSADHSWGHATPDHVMAELDRTHPIRERRQGRALSAKAREGIRKALERSAEPTALGEMAKARRKAMR